MVFQILLSIAALLLGFLIFEFGRLVGARQTADKFKETVGLLIRITDEMQETVSNMLAAKDVKIKNALQERKKK